MNLWKINSFGLVFVVAILLWVFVVGFSSNQPGSFFNKNHNAVWAGHEWVGERKSDAEIQEFVSNLKAHGIDTVFVHSGPLMEDGRVDEETYRYAVMFIEKAKQFDPEIQYQAWLGQIRNKIDLEDEEVRHNIAKECMIFSQLVGFDGIHFDIEPVWDRDLAFLQTLEECREILPEGKKISVALAEFIPQAWLWWLEGTHPFANYNSEVNYENVAEYADQIVVMTYDTNISRGWLYRWLVKEQTIRVTKLMEGKEVFIGIPSYEEEKEFFDPKVENIENGLKGIISGLNNFRSEEENFAGVAIYAHWEMEEDEWQIFENLWLK